MAEDRSGLMKVAFEDIEVGVVDNHRIDFGDLAGLADSIVKDGLLQPLVVLHKHYGGNGCVRPDGKKVFSRYILVAGHRRLRAIERIRKQKPGSFDQIPVVLFRGNETDAKLAQLAENIERKALNYVEQAEAFRGLINCGMSSTEIAKRIRMTERWVSQLLAIREKCCTAVLKALAAGEITVDVAAAIGSIEGEAAQVRQMQKYLGTKQEKGKGEAKRETQKDTGRKSRPALKKLKKMFGEVASLQRKAGEKDATRSEWIGACRAIECAMGDDEDMLEEAEKIVERLRKLEKNEPADDDDAEE